MMHAMEHMGWNQHFAEHFKPFETTGYVPARVTRVDRGIFTVIHKDGECVVKVTGKFQFDATSKFEFPTVGDWVVLELETSTQSGRIHALLTRQSSLSRMLSKDDNQQQTLAANVDTVLIVCGMDFDFNVRRIERALTLCYSGNVTPVILLNKIDVCDDVDQKVAQLQDIAPDVAIYPISVTQHIGLDALQLYLSASQTICVFGSSGVGKSSLINHLLGEEKMLVKEIRASDSHGRHTTRHREMFSLPQGCVIIDIPGVREVGMWTDDEDGLQTSFSDIEALAQNCKFNDCKHAHEPGCAIKAAIDDGELEASRMENYRDMLLEVKQAQEKKDRLAKKLERKGKGRKRR